MKPFSVIDNPMTSEAHRASEVMFFTRCASGIEGVQDAPGDLGRALPAAQPRRGLTGSVNQLYWRIVRLTWLAAFSTPVV